VIDGIFFKLVLLIECRSSCIASAAIFGRLPVKNIRGPDHYRAEAAHFLELAAAADDARLRDSYLGLCIQYERLADVLECSSPRNTAAALNEPQPAGKGQPANDRNQCGGIVSGFAPSFSASSTKS
jgi:hypothetical protein